MTASNVLGFTFTPQMSLLQLARTSTQTSFAGAISETNSVPDNASTAGLLGLGAVAIVLGAMGQRRRTRAVS